MKPFVFTQSDAASGPRERRKQPAPQLCERERHRDQDEDDGDESLDEPHDPGEAAVADGAPQRLAHRQHEPDPRR